MTHIEDIGIARKDAKTQRLLVMEYFKSNIIAMNN